MRKFKKIYVEITNACNLSCSFCRGTKRKKEFMDKEFFKFVLGAIKGCGEYLYFHVMGEPLLHPDTGKFLDICSDFGYKVNITTNGTLNKELLAVKNKPALRQVNFSLHSGNDTAYFNSVLDAADKLNKEGKLVSLRLWNLGSGEDNSAIISKIKEKFGADFDAGGIPAHARGIKLAENIFLNMGERFEWPDLNAGFISDTGFCYGLRDQIGILVDGTVVPCCLDADGVIALGNIKEQKLEDIVNSKRAKEMYDAFSGRKVREELCKRCGYRTRFSSP